MKNKIVSILLSAAMAVTMLANTNTVSASGKTAQVTKDEVVYVKTDADGSETSRIISDQLLNIEGLKEIADVSGLMNIVNVKGDENFTQKAGALNWENDGSSEICYQGTSARELPVGITITYELNGKKLSAEDLKGKSGHLVMHVDYENHTEKEAYVPFLMATAMLIKVENTFSNITVDHGKLISDGDRQVVIGYGVPGLGEYLNLDQKETDHAEKDDSKAAWTDFDIPEGFTVEADVKEYQGISLMSMGTSEIFKDIKKDKLENADDMKASLEDLQSAADELTDGTGKLKEGTDTLASSTGDLLSGVDKLNNGGSTLASGAETLYQGADQLRGGAAELAAGTGKLKEGSQNLADGSAQIAAGTADAKSGADALDNGLAQVNAGINDMQAKAGAGIGQLTQGAGQLKGGIAQAAAGAAQLAGGITQAAEGAGQLSGAAAQAKQGTAGIKALAGQITGAIPSSVTVAVSEEAAATAYVDNSDLRAAVESALRNAGIEDEGAIQAAVNSVSDKEVTAVAPINKEVEVPVDVDATSLAVISANLSAAADALDGALTQIRGGAAALQSNLSDTIGQGANTLAASLGEEGALYQGAAGLEAGLAQLGTSLADGTDNLMGGISQLSEGSKALSAGLGTLKDGTADLYSGAKQLNQGLASADDGAQKLSGGADSLASGAGTLAGGASELSNGLISLADGSVKLSDGILQLSSGADDLNDGMIRFNEEGITKLTELLGDDLEEVLDRVKLMLDNAKAYKSYSGISEDMDGQVKFIFVTEE